ncbi:hypothetical protein [Yinghuangia sp. YIM S09857]|uniref:hypothetical protein n=1 Tax=Yinghuangia sp. YIM S09857 TaxID=3436929 RepID=UPI003F530CB1
MTPATEPDPTPAGDPGAPATLCGGVLARLLDATDLTEVSDDPLRAPNGQPVGRLRTFVGSAVAHAVYIGLTVPPIGLDSHMVFAFGPADSGLPHFTVDSVATGEAYAFHLDLVQRADLAVHVEYMDAVYAPLTEAFDRARSIPGLTAAAIGPRQRALMSPWMLVHRATAEAFAAAHEPVHTYLEHWLDLVAKGVPHPAAQTLSDTDLPERDRTLRRRLFSREVDPVWTQVSRLLGDEETDRIRTLLIDGPPHEPSEGGHPS